MKSLTFSEQLDVGLVREIVWVDEGWVEGVLGLEADRALAAWVQQDRLDREALTAQRLAVDRAPNLR